MVDEDRPRWSVALPFGPFIPVLLVLVVAIGGALVTALLLPAASGIGYAVDKVDQRLEFLGQCKKIGTFPQRSTVYAGDGKTELATLYLDYNREVVQLDQISDIAKSSVLAIEDDGFYQHGAANFPSLVRAAIANVLHGSVVQGGSTITEQLVKNAVTFDTAQTYERKFQEAAIGACLEQRYSKDQILALYLNDVYFGNGVYGIGAAADLYFHKSSAKLNLPEGALLAGLIRAPEYYNPIHHPKKGLARRNEVLDRLGALGWVPQAKIDKAKLAPLGLAPDAGQTHLAQPPFFVKYIVDQIIQNPTGEYDALGATNKQRTRTLYQGGLSIFTTLDPQWQRDAQTAANAPWAIAPSNPGNREKPDAAIVSIDTGNGAIRTMLSGRNFQKDQIALATAGRQPGSSFKPFTLAAAFQQNVPPGAEFSSRSPFHTSAWDNSCHCVVNAEGAGDQGYLNLWQATADSVNVVFAQLELSLKGQAAAVVAAAHKMGITSPLIAVPSLTLGTEEVSPLEMASAYQTLADGGKHCEPYAVARITSGQEGTLYRHHPVCKQVIRPDVANLITAMLRGVVQHGTGTAASLGARPVAGKTGTTQGYSNAWFVGYTRQVSTAVWVGFPFSTHSLSNYFGGSVFGGTVAAPIWHAYMTRVTAGQPVEGFPAPPAPQSGKVPNVVGLGQKKAQGALGKAFFTPKVAKVPSVEPAGTVVRQDPHAGASLQLGSLVTIFVSNGKAPQIDVPDTRGLTADAATKALEAAGFTVKVVEKAVTQPVRDGIVLSQDPRPGTKADKGSEVTIVVGKLNTGGGGHRLPLLRLLR